MDIDNKVAVVTGGSTGIGRAVALQLAEAGAKIVIAARRSDRVAAAVADLRATGAEAIGVPTDIAKLDEVQALADAAYEEFGRVDIALFNAGFSSSDNILDPDLATWQRSIEGNVLGLLHCIKMFVPRMLQESDPGAVYATTSGAGIHGTTVRTAPYAAVKNAQLTMMECLYGQVRDAGAGLRVGVIVPPLTRTNLAGDDLAIWDRVTAGLGREGSPAPLIEPEEFAQVILDGIRADRFWIESTPEDDERYYGGRYAGSIRASRRRIQAKAAALATHTPPETYLW